MAFGDAAVPKALWNTFILGSARVAITTVLSVFFAWVITRTDTPGKSFIEFMLWLGFFLPLLPMTLGWILLLDPNYGLINKLAVDWLGMSRGPFNIYTYGGIIWAHLAFSTCVRFILLTPAFKALDATLEEAAQVAGSSALTTLMRVTVPVLLPAVLATTMLSFIKSLESMEIEIVLGVPARIFVFSTLVWDYAHFQPPAYHAATALSSIFLVAVFGLIWLQRIMLGGRDYTTVGGRSYSVRVQSIGRWRWVTFGVCIAFIFVMIVLPMAVLILGTFMKAFGYFSIPEPWTVNNWSGAFADPILLRSLRNTLILGAGAGGLGALVYAILGYNIVRSTTHGSPCAGLSRLAAMGIARRADQLGATIGDIGYRQGGNADLRNALFADLGDHYQGTAVGHADLQSQRHANRQRTRREFVCQWRFRRPNLR